MDKDIIKSRIDKIDLYEQILNFEDLGNRLQFLRTKYRSISVPDLAEKLDISKNQLYSYERNENYPKIDRLKTISDFYNIDPLVLNPKTSNKIYRWDLTFIQDIYDSINYEVNVNKKKNISVYNNTKIIISECNALVFILSILPEKYEKEFTEYIVNSLLVVTKDLEPSKDKIIEFLNNEKLKAENCESDILLDFLFRPIERSLGFDFYNQKTFNHLLKLLLDVIKILFL